MNYALLTLFECCCSKIWS